MLIADLPLLLGPWGLRSVEILVSKSACSLGATIPRPRLDAAGAEWVLEVAVHVIFGANLECQHGVIRRVFGGDLGKCPLGPERIVSSRQLGKCDNLGGSHDDILVDRCGEGRASGLRRWLGPVFGGRNTASRMGQRSALLLRNIN